MPIITLWYWCFHGERISFKYHFQFSRNFFHDRFHEIMRSFSCWNGAAPLLPLLSRNFMGKFRLETLVSRNNAIFFLLKRSRFYLYFHEIMRSFSCWNGAVLPLLSRNFMGNFFLKLWRLFPRHEIMRSFSCWNGAVFALLSWNFMGNFFLKLWRLFPRSFSRNI